MAQHVVFVWEMAVPMGLHCRHRTDASSEITPVVVHRWDQWLINAGPQGVGPGSVGWMKQMSSRESRPQHSLNVASASTKWGWMAPLCVKPQHLMRGCYSVGSLGTFGFFSLDSW